MATADAPAVRRWYCTGCGRPATFRHATVDPRYPIVWCGSEPKPCGLVPGLADQAAAIELSREREAAKVARRHAVHEREGVLRPSCPGCRPALDHRRHIERRQYVTTCTACEQARARTAPNIHGA